MVDKIDRLINLIDNNQSKDDIIAAQKEFTQTVEEAMVAFKNGKITVDISKALPLVMYNWVVEELPSKIVDPENYKDIKRELILFKSNITIVLNPAEV
ncbi:MAG: hypothetical protein ACP6IY_21310 [Promethearchaeia archaeon]